MKLKPEDIELRIDDISAVGITLVPYIEITAVQEALDEEFGVLGWKDEYVDVVLPNGRNKLKGTLSVYDKDRNEWVSRSDYGATTSQREWIVDKALCTDTLKRCAKKFGIGRELNKLPKFFVKNGEGCSVKTASSDVDYCCYDSFYVSDLVYRGNEITAICIKNAETNKNVFVYNTLTEEEKREYLAKKMKELEERKKASEPLELGEASGIDIENVPGATLYPDVGTESMCATPLFLLTEGELKTVFEKTKSNDVKAGCMNVAMVRKWKLN